MRYRYSQLARFFQRKNFLPNDLVILKAQLISYNLILSKHSEYEPGTTVKGKVVPVPN
jgi:hypothetical protein